MFSEFRFQNAKLFAFCFDFCYPHNLVLEKQLLNRKLVFEEIFYFFVVSACIISKMIS